LEQVTIAGRTAARLGRWELKTVGSSFIVEAAVTESDDYLLSMPSKRGLRLNVGKNVYVWKNVEVGGGGDQLTISGSGKMTLVPRD
jgi:hypothetical protein